MANVAESLISLWHVKMKAAVAGAASGWLVMARHVAARWLSKAQSAQWRKYGKTVPAASMAM
jgi:hypothetical protein